MVSGWQESVENGLFSDIWQQFRQRQVGVDENFTLWAVGAVL